MNINPRDIFKIKLVSGNTEVTLNDGRNFILKGKYHIYVDSLSQPHLHETIDPILSDKFEKEETKHYVASAIIFVIIILILLFYFLKKFVFF